MALTKITPQMFDTSAAGHDFNIDNGTFVVDASANRVGIGTTTPSTLLDVNGVLTATTIAGTLTTAAQTNITSLGTLTGLTMSGALNMGNQLLTNVGATITFSTSVDGTINFPSTGRINFDSDNNSAGEDFIIGSNRTAGSGGNEHLRITAAGNVGINTNAPNALLEVNDAITFSNIDTFGQFVIKSAAGTTGQMMNFGVSTAGNGYSFIQSLNRGTAHDSLVFQPYGGNVLIGTSTETAAYSSFVSGQSNKIFEISTAAAANQGGSTIVFNNQTANDSNLTLGSLTFATSGTSSAEKRGAIIAVSTTADSSSNVSAGMNFWTNNAGTISKKMEITPAGQILIGDGSTSVPSFSFLNDTDTGILRVTTNALGITAGGSRKFYVNATNAYYQNLTQVQIDGGNFYVDGRTGFRTQPDSNYAIKLLQSSSLTHGGYFQINGGTATGLEINATSGSYSGTALFVQQSTVATGGFLARFANSSGNKVTISTVGNVGIGTSSPGAALDIETAGNTADGTYYSTITINNTGSSTYSRLRFDRSGSARWGLGLRNDDKFQIAKLFNTASDNTFVIDSSGRIGINTGAPSRRKLEITDSSPGVVFHDSNVTNLTHEIVGGGNAGLEYSADYQNVGAGYHRWDVGGAERMRLIESGRLGIGTGTEATASGSLHVRQKDVNGADVAVVAQNTTNNRIAGFHVQDEGGAARLKMQYDNGSNLASIINDSPAACNFNILTTAPRNTYVALNYVAEISESFNLAGNTTYNFDYTVPNEGGHGNSFFIIAGFNHFHSASYGAHRVAFVSTRGTSLSVHSSVINQTSGYGGQWNFSKTSATTLRIQKAAGTYTGSGSGFIKIFFRNAIG